MIDATFDGDVRRRRSTAMLDGAVRRRCSTPISTAT